MKATLLIRRSLRSSKTSSSTAYNSLKCGPETILCLRTREGKISTTCQPLLKFHGHTSTFALGTEFESLASKYKKNILFIKITIIITAITIKVMIIHS